MRSGALSVAMLVLAAASAHAQTSSAVPSPVGFKVGDGRLHLLGEIDSRFDSLVGRFSSLNANASSVVMQLSATDNGTNTNTSRRFTVELDANIIQNHTPLYPATNGDPWTGVAFGSKIGTWFHPTSGTTSAYGSDPANPNFNYLTSFGYASQSSFDTANLNAQWVPSPGALALVGLAGVVGIRRRR